MKYSFHANHQTRGRNMVYYRKVTYESIYFNVLIVDVDHIVSHQQKYMASTIHYQVYITIKITLPPNEK